MNRIDRMTGILLLLQGQGRKRSAREIAERFETSKRTVMRDIQALCEMGIPIATSLGISGGYTLLPDYSLPPLALTFHEAALLRLSLGSLSQLGETPFKKERESLMDKIQTLLPQNDHQKIDQFEQTLSLNTPSQPYPTPFLDQLLESAHTQSWLAVTYRSQRGESQQTILPTHLRTTAGLWYCEAYSLERQERRVYRVDRFLAVAPTRAPERISLPPTLERNKEHEASSSEVRIQLTTRGVLILEHDLCLGPRIQKKETGAGWLHLHIQPQDYDWIVRVVLSLGTEATVHSPEILKQRVQQEAQAIANQYTK
jgi:predicted DNA-binding transcriptional regulator YafY